MKNGKHDSSKPVQISIPQKDAIAIEPPKKVIKALYDWDGKNDPSMYLPFSAGDFLHVLSRENDSDWYEACNPLRNERGLVPVSFFENVGKTVRDSGSSAKSGGSGTHDSGYGGGSIGPANGAMPIRQSNGTSMPGHRVTRSIGKSSGGLYGIVSYDFHAERPDELDAKEGEAIIVIAQSNPEWFVAKPITRLGGPGLIPVSFVEIRDMASGKAVEDPSAAVAKAGIPRVEEWKKMAAEYKNTSIPLGTVSSSQQMSNLQQGMDRMSVSNGSSNAQGHARQMSGSMRPPQQSGFVPVRASVPRYVYADDKFQFIVECKMSNNAHWDLSRKYEDFYELQINLINAFPEEAGQVPGKPRILPYMPGPVKYVTDNISEGRRSNLDEYLRDLLRLSPHIVGSTLVRNFFVPREGDYEVESNAIDVNDHARAMTSGPRYSQISQHGQGTQGPPPQQQAQPQQQQSYQQQQYQQPHYQQSPYQQQQYQQSPYQQQQPPQRPQAPPSQQPSQPPQSRQPPNQASNPYNSPLTSSGPYGHQRAQPSQPQSSYSSHQAAPSANSASNSSISGMSRPTATNTPSSSSAAISSTVPVKVKAWFDRDTCVVIRMPPRGQFSYDELYKKIVERRKLEYKGQDQNHDNLDIEYRDETNGDYYRLEGDEDLEIAVERNDKLTLAVRAVTQAP